MLVTKAGGKYGQCDVKELLPGKSPPTDGSLEPVYCLPVSDQPFSSAQPLAFLLFHPLHTCAASVLSQLCLNGAIQCSGV